MSLVARHLEANGIPTVIVGSARDIVEYCGVPRFLFTDFPLGNPCGKPYDRTMQRDIVARALDVLESATEPRTTVQTPYVWSEDVSRQGEKEPWRDDYLRVDPAEIDELRAQGERRRARQQQLKEQGVERSDPGA